MRLHVALCAMILACLLAISAPSLLGQTAATGSITGTVTDPTGAVVPNVTVTATGETGQVRTATTGGDGSYTISLLNPGNYRVKFEAAGFRAVEVPAVTVTVTEAGTLNRRLEVGAQTQEVTVEANVETVQTSSSSVGTVVGSKGLTEIPLSTRNYTNLITLSAGANASVQNATAIGKGSDNVSVNGSSTAQNAFLMDGVSLAASGSNNALNEAGTYGSIGLPNPDALQEFKIQTSAFDASYGRNPGASVNVVTKTGTNAYHGTAFEFFRNTVLNANDSFLKKSELSQGLPNKEGVLNQNQYGGVFGGPIKKDKFFFFVSYQNTWQRNGYSTNGFSSGVNLPPLPDGDRGTCLLTATSVAGCNATAQTFAAGLGANVCPSTATTMTQNIAGSQAGSKPATSASANNAVLTGTQVACDGSNINPVALRILQLKYPNGSYYVPSSHLIPSSANNFGYQGATYSLPALYWEHQGNGNFDYVINSKNTISAKQFYSRDNIGAAFDIQGAGVGTIFLPGSGAQLGYLYDNSLLKLTTIVTNNLVNEARISYQRNATYITPIPGNGLTQLYSDSQVGIRPIQPGIDILSYIQINGLFQIGNQDSAWVYAHSNDFQAADQISWTHGKHTIRAGFEGTHELWHYNLVGFPIGQAALNSFADFLVGLPGCAPGATCAPGTTNGTGFGAIASVTTTSRTQPGGNIHNLLTHSDGAFVQDDFKVSQRLTFNLGLRWEYDSIMSDQQGQNTNQWASLIQGAPFPGTGCIYNSFQFGAVGGTGCSFVGYVVPANYQVSTSGPLPSGVYQNNVNGVIQSKPPWDNFAPRVGFAWQPLPTNRFVVRGGFGYFYDRLDGGRVGTGFPNEPPYTTPLAGSGTALVTSSLADPFLHTPLGWIPRYTNFATGASSNYLLGGGGGQFNPIFTTPLVYQYSLNIQYEFLPSWVAEIGYVGSQGIHQVLAQPINAALLANAANPLYCGYDGNAAHCITNSTSSGATGPAVRVPLPGFSPTQAQLSTNAGFKYNSFQATVRKQLAHGFTLQAAYTWSRAFASSWVGNANASFTDNVPMIMEYGLNTNYHPQRLTFSYAWELPFGHHTGLMDKVTSGWVVSGVTTIQDGVPMTVTDSRMGTVFGASVVPVLGNGQYAAGFGPSNIETTGSPYSKVLGHYLNPLAFASSNPASALAGCSTCTGNLFGNSGLGTVLGPGQDNWDMSLSKLTRVGGLREDATLQFRAEFFNLFNHPQYNNPNLAANSNAFGTITSASVNQRLMQLALKYSF